MAKTIGRFTPAEAPQLPASFGSYAIEQDGFRDRLNLIANSVSPTTLDSIRSEAESGKLGRLYELYEKMVATDARVGGIVGSLKATVAGLPLKTMMAETASAAERRIAEDYRNVVREALIQIDSHSFVSQLVDVYLWGTRAFQLKWRIEDYPRGKKLALPDIVPIAGQAMEQEMQQLHEKYGELKVITMDSPAGLFFSEIDKRRAFVVTDGTAKARHDTVGALRRVLGWWITKMYAQLWWAEYVESYGQPMRIGRYTPESGSSEKAELKRFLRGIGRNKWGLFPQGADVQLLEANQSGNITTFSDVAKFANNEIAVALIGQTGITQDSAQGSRAKLQVLNGIRQEIVGHNAEIVRKGFGQLVDALLQVNYGDSYVRRLRPSVYPIVPKPGELKDKLDAYIQMAEAGIPISVDEIHEQTGTPQPEAGQLVLWRGGITPMGELEDMEEERKNERTGIQSAEGSVPGREDESGSDEDRAADRETDQGSDA